MATMFNAIVEKFCFFGQGCIIHTKEVQACVQIPSNVFDTEDFNEDQARSSHIHHTILAKKLVVHPTPTDESGPVLEASPR